MQKEKFLVVVLVPPGKTVPHHFAGVQPPTNGLTPLKGRYSEGFPLDQISEADAAGAVGRVELPPDHR